MGVINDNTSRRKFLSSAFMSLGLLFGLGTLGQRFFKFLTPETRKKEFQEILVGTEKEMSGSEAVEMEVAGNKLLLLTTATGLAAFSRKCTDLGCLVNWDGSKEVFICPCHNGVYDRNGKNISGPPPRPLDRFPVVKRGEYIYVKVKTA